MERKVAIITGSRRGIGEAIAYKLAQNGYSIVINDKEDKKQVDNVVKKLQEKYNVSAIGIIADVSKENEVKKKMKLKRYYKQLRANLEE